MDPRRTIATPRAGARTFARGTAGPGEIGYPPAGARSMNVKGQPVWEKLVRYAPIEDIGRCERRETLFIIAGGEEVHDNRDHAILAHDRGADIRGPATIPGMRHCGDSREARGRAEDQAIARSDEDARERG